MSQKIILLLILILTSCKVKQKNIHEVKLQLIGKILDVENNEINEVEIISKDYSMILYSDINGNFIITRKDFIKDFMDGYDALISLKKEGFVTKKIRLNKATHFYSNNRLKFFTLIKIENPKKAIQKTKETKTMVVETIKRKEPENNKDIYTDINIGEINNEKGNIHVGPEYNDNSTTINEGDKTTIINETKIIKDTKIIEIPFKERDCAKKEIGYVLIKNSYNEGVNIKLTTYGPKKSPMAMGFDYYTIANKSSKILRLQSDYHYSLDGEKFSEKWAGTFVYGFSDGFYVNPCDTITIITPQRKPASPFH